MKLYKKGERLHFLHKASMVCNFLGVADKVTLYDKLPNGCKREDFHRVSFEVVKTKKEMAETQRRLKQATKKALGVPSPGAGKRKGK